MHGWKILAVINVVQIVRISGRNRDSEVLNSLTVSKIVKAVMLGGHRTVERDSNRHGNTGKAVDTIEAIIRSRSSEPETIGDMNTLSVAELAGTLI